MFQALWRKIECNVNQEVELKFSISMYIHIEILRQVKVSANSALSYERYLTHSQFPYGILTPVSLFKIPYDICSWSMILKYDIIL